MSSAYRKAPAKAKPKYKPYPDLRS